MLSEGLTYTSHLVVEKENTALALGSGDMEVLATPQMMALMENAAMNAVAHELPEGFTTVGGHIESSHIKPSKIGSNVSAIATLTKVDGKKLYFDIKAVMGEDVIGEGKHLRFIVDREKFLSRL